MILHGLDWTVRSPPIQSCKIASDMKIDIMQLKTFVIPVLSPERSEGDLNAFLRGHRVLYVERQLVKAAS